MTIQIRRHGRDYNYTVRRNGKHVGAIVEVTEGGRAHWRLWKDRDKFKQDELEIIDGFAAALNQKIAALSSARPETGAAEGDGRE